MKSVEAELIYLTKVICGECPVWDEKTQKLYWADLVNCHVYIFDLENEANTGYNIGNVAGGLALCEDGRLLLANANGFNFFDPLTGNIEFINDPEEEFSDHFFGDGKCDPDGRFWAGTYHEDINKPVGSLYSLEADLSIKKRFENVTLSNGLAWDADRKKFYYIDSIAQSIYSFDYEAGSGNISNQQTLRKIHGDNKLPDGMTIDSEGFLWVAVYNAGKVIRINPDSGETVFEVLVPHARQATSCTFGGKYFDHLFITTAKELNGPYGIPEDELGSQKYAGGLFKVKLPFKGLPTARFKIAFK